MEHACGVMSMCAKWKGREVRIKMFTRSLPALLLLCIAVSASLLRAQTTTTGELAGTVTDPSGAILTSASVTLTNVATGAKQITQTNSTGAYRFPLLQPGSYRVSA